MTAELEHALAKHEARYQRIEAEQRTPVLVEREFAPLHPTLVKWARRRFRRDAEDLVQSAFVAVILDLRRGKVIRQPLAWMYREVRFQFAHRVRKERGEAASGPRQFVPLMENDGSGCPNCDHTLRDERCKLVCEHCGYFQSCSEGH